jgi:ATP diphosphatase
MTPSKDISRLLEIMAALRTPGSGCPWDLEQTFATIAPYTIEEAYEVADAIQRGDLAELKEELGDLLLQVVYHARMGEEAGAFQFGDVVEAITAKMIRRHPHVFGDKQARDAGAVKGFWERAKAEEKANRAQEASLHAASLLDEVPVALPALTRAVKLQDKAAKVGFDWPSLAPVFEKLKEEMAELEEIALPVDPRGNPPPPGGEGSGSGGATTDVGISPSPGPPPQGGREIRAKIEEELGDLLFVVANVARHLKIDPEAALRAANQKFIRRFCHIEERLAALGRSPAQSDLAEMDALWEEAKGKEQAP